MTVLRNSIHIDAPPERVWAVLARLDALERYDPGIAKSALTSSHHEGLGASRHCDLRGGGWFEERVSVWSPHRELELELYDCTLPVRRLRHHYTLTVDDTGTRVDQRQEYELKFGMFGRLLDLLVVRRKWDSGIKTFFLGLKAYAESREPSSDT